MHASFLSKWLTPSLERIMHILAVVQGEFGRRKVRNIKKHCPEGWGIYVHELPDTLPTILDEPEDFLPGNLPTADLLLALGEAPAAAQLIPEIAKLAKVKAVLAPIDDREWLPLGLENQIKNELRSRGVAFAFPMPFCVLHGIRCAGGIIQEMKVERDAPCGNTRYVAQKLIGAKTETAAILAQQYHHQYPCLASSIKDKHAHDNIMNRAGRILEKEIKRCLRSTT